MEKQEEIFLRAEYGRLLDYNLFSHIFNGKVNNIFTIDHIYKNMNRYLNYRFPDNWNGSFMHQYRGGGNGTPPVCQYHKIDYNRPSYEHIPSTHYCYTYNFYLLLCLFYEILMGRLIVLNFNKSLKFCFCYPNASLNFFDYFGRLIKQWKLQLYSNSN